MRLIRTHRRSVWTLAVAAGIVSAVFVIRSVYAGPPAICHPVEIGEAQSLPWGDGAFSEKFGYTKNQAIKDTLRIVESTDDPLVHMETMRRATLYLNGDEDKALALLASLMARAMDADCSDKPSAMAWFDAGYLAQCYHQIGLDVPVTCGKQDDIVGYAWVNRAITLQPDDAALEFGAAMVTAIDNQEANKKHVDRVKQLASRESLVLANLAHHSSAIWGSHRGHARR